MKPGFTNNFLIKLSSKSIKFAPVVSYESGGGQDVHPPTIQKRLVVSWAAYGNWSQPFSDQGRGMGRFLSHFFPHPSAPNLLTARE
jgi:hypothetical protein